MGVQIVISFYLVYLEFGLLDNMEVLSLFFWYLHIIFHSGLPTYIPINSTRCSFSKFTNCCYPLSF